MPQFKIKSIKYKSAFTLVELILVLLIVGLILPIIFQVYTFISRANNEIVVRQHTIQESYELLERLNVMMQNYTIDYEEYFNRQKVGCVGDGGENFSRNVGLSGYCSNFTAYGNRNSTKRRGLNDTGYHDIYYCSSQGIHDGTNSVGDYKVVKSDCGKLDGYQSYRQYQSLFIDVRRSSEGSPSIVGDSDDEDLGKIINNISAVADPNNVQEIYLISIDGKTRLFFRRKLVAQEGGRAQYKLQMLRLRGFDAGQKHNYDFNVANNEGLYDGKIDTWACDASMGFKCKGASLSGAYSEYNLPADVDDGWIDMTQGGLSVLSRNISVSPTDDPDLRWNDPNRQINPFFTLQIVNGNYLPYYKNTISESIEDFKVALRTTYNMKHFYTE